MSTLRTKEMEEKYSSYLKDRGANQPCALCTKKSLKTFKHWKIVENQFPWDKLV